MCLFETFDLSSKGFSGKVRSNNRGFFSRNWKGLSLFVSHGMWVNGRWVVDSKLGEMMAHCPRRMVHALSVGSKTSATNDSKGDVKRRSK